MSPSSRRSVAALGALALAVAATGCSDGATSPNSRGLSIAAGGGQTDTVLSTLPQALIMQLHATSGLEGHVVQFQAVPTPSASNHVYGAYYALVHRLDSNQPATFAADTTNALGQAEVQVVLGPLAGPAPITVSVPDLGIVDTVTFMATPGQAGGISVSPQDTAVTVNGSLTLRGGATDTYGNLRTDPVTFSVLTGPATVSSATVTGTAVGRVSILAQADGYAETTHVSVVPVGTLAAGLMSQIVIFNLDGSGMQTVPNATSVGSIRWAPSGTSLVYDQTEGGGLYGGSAVLNTVTVGGTVTPVDQSPGYEDVWPQWSRDGSTIYFSKLNGSATGTLWHVTPSGTNDDSVSSQNPSYDIFPSPSPDGSQLAYIADNDYNDDLRILTLATGAVTDLHISAWSPVWSPTGQQLAIIYEPAVANEIAVVNADGTGLRTLVYESYAQNFDWSPDGQYIVAMTPTSGLIELIVVSTGERIPLPYTQSFYSPTWKPGSGSSALRVPSAPRSRTNAARRRL